MNVREEDCDLLPLTISQRVDAVCRQNGLLGCERNTALIAKHRGRAIGRPAGQTQAIQWFAASLAKAAALDILCLAVPTPDHGIGPTRFASVYESYIRTLG